MNLVLNAVDIVNKALFPKLSENTSKIMRSQIVSVKSRTTFKSPATVEKEMSMLKLKIKAGPTPINKYIKAKAKSSMKRQRKKKISKNQLKCYKII